MLGIGGYRHVVPPARWMAEFTASRWLGLDEPSWRTFDGLDIFVRSQVIFIGRAAADGLARVEIDRGNIAKRAAHVGILASLACGVTDIEFQGDAHTVAYAHLAASGIGLLAGAPMAALQDVYSGRWLEMPSVDRAATMRRAARRLDEVFAALVVDQPPAEQPVAALREFRLR